MLCVFRLFATILTLSWTTTALAAPSAIERYFEGLQQRGLFDLAEGEALRRLEMKLSPSERAQFVAALAQTFTEHAKYVDAREQADLWQRARTLLDDFQKEHPQFSGGIRLDVLRGELALSRGTTLRWLIELDAEAEAASADAALTEAVTVLSAAESELAQRLRRRIRGHTTAIEPLDPIELDELLARTRLMLGTAHLERARLAGESGRASHLAEAETWLSELAKGAIADEPTWRSQILLAEAARLKGQTDLGRRRLADLKPTLLPDRAKDAIAEVSTKLLLDEDKPDRAVDFLIDYRRTRGELTGELRLLQIRGLSDAALAVEALGNQQEADQLRAQIPNVVEWTQAEHGGYWAYRARLAERLAVQSARYGPQIAAQVRQAEAAQRRQQIDVALTAYEQAIDLAHDKPDVAFELASARASLLISAGRFDEAARSLTALVDAHPDDPATPRLHLLSAYALGRTHDAEPSPDRRAAYVERLQEHRQRFSDSPTAVQATLRLASLHEQRRQYSKAIPLFSEITDDAEHGAVAAAAVARNYENLLNHLRSARRSAPTREAAIVRDRQITEWSAAAARDMTTITEPLRNSKTSAPAMTRPQAELALRASRLLLTDPAGHSAADALLDRLAAAFLVEHPVGEEAFWHAVRRGSLPLRIVSLATQKRFQEASRLIESLASAPAGDLLSVVRGLSELTETDPRIGQPVVFGVADGPVGPRLTDLRRTATTMLAERRSELSAEEAGQLDVVLARANLADGRSAVAVDRYDAALAERPRDKALLTQAATALQNADTPQATRKALEYWKRLEDLETPGSEPWLGTRLRVIETHLALGETATARKLLTVTRLLHPQLGGGDLKAAYEAVGMQVNSATSSAPRSEPH